MEVWPVRYSKRSKDLEDLGGLVGKILDALVSWSAISWSPTTTIGSLIGRMSMNIRGGRPSARFIDTIARSA